MNNVDPQWNGMSKAYEVRMNDHYAYGNFEDEYAAGVQVNGLADLYDSQVVQFNGEVSKMLPPFKISTGLRNAPDVPNPYLDQRDASYIYEDNYYSNATDNSHPNKEINDKATAQSFDAFAPETMNMPWEWGENDLQSMFVDYFYDERDEYLATLNIATTAAMNGAEGESYGYEYNEYQSILEDNLDGRKYQDSWMIQVFDQTRNSEQWTENELQEVSYIYDWNLECQTQDESQPTETHLEASAPDVIMTIDHQGRCTPMASGVMVVKDVQGRACSRLLRVLYDSGGSKSMCHRRILPKGARITQDSERTMMNTLAGAYSPLGSVDIRGMRLPAFDKNRIIDQHEFLVFDAQCKYDIILGGDFLKKIGMNLKYDNLEVEWLGNTIPMQTMDNSNMVAAHVETYLSQMEVDELGFDLDSYLTAPIMDAKYEKLNIDKVVKEHCSHLNPKQQADLHEVLSRHTKLFDGTLGKYPGEPMHIEIEPDATPVYRRPYPVPHVHLETFKKELDHLAEIGVLSPVRDTEWGLPTFITPKKDGRVRWVSDMRELNKVIKRTQYTLPIINDTLRKRKGYEFLSKLDISMQFYTFELDEESKKLCTIVTPFGPYCYNRVPMGLKISPGYAQARMEETLRGIEEIEVYIDDIGIFTTDWEKHIEVLGEVLKRLEDNGFTINPLKCEWGVKETDWLGY